MATAGGGHYLPHRLRSPRRTQGRDAARNHDAPALCADIDGFSLHAAVRMGAHDRRRLEHLCRSITRPALSNERVQLSTTHLVISSLEFMQRLPALMPYDPSCT